MNCCPMNFRRFLFGWLITIVSTVASTMAQSQVTSVYQITDSPATFLQATLDYDIYRYSANSQLQDLVVLDNQGTRLPYRILAIPGEVNESQVLAPLRFFPVAVGAAPETWRSGKTLIRIDDDAISIGRDKTGTESTAAIDFYLLDISDFEARIDNLVLDWQTDSNNQYLDVQISGTRDLQHWTPLAQETLAHLQRDGETLLRNEVHLGISPRQYYYLRLNFSRGGNKLQLSNISAKTITRTPGIISVDTWSIEGGPAKDQSSALRTASGSSKSTVAAWEFQREERAPISRFHIDLGNHAYSNHIGIFSRARENQPWRLLYNGIWFNAQVGTQWQHSDALRVQPNTDTYWRVELDETMREWVKPALVFEHPRSLLQFVANHAAPYTLAIDHNPANNQHVSPQVFAQLIGDGKREWTSVELMPLNPDITRFAADIPGINWPRILFWGVLLLAVAVLVGFAVRLFRQMQ